VLAVWKGPFGWSGDVDYHGVVTYALEIENTGASIAQDVYMTDVLPANVTFGGWLAQNEARDGVRQRERRIPFRGDAYRRLR